MKTATIVCDPVSRNASVQLGLLNMVIKSLKGYDAIIVISPYIPDTQQQIIEEMASGNVDSLSVRRFLLHLIFRVLENNEAMLWAASWFLQALFSANSSCANELLQTQQDSTVVNISYTVPLRCRLFWNQATPPLETLRVMGQTNFLARIIYLLGKRFLNAIDRRIERSHFAQAEEFVNNSAYLKNLYRSMGHPSDIVLHVPREFSPIMPQENPPARDYVLVYIGKEVEVDTILELASSGIRVVSFGAKIPFGTSISELKKKVEFLGFVDDSRLSHLYYNALFTAFPFTEEPFGWVPLESMHFGTPVLSYKRQGPSETIIDNKTGWLVETKEQFIEKAMLLWKMKETMISPDECIKRADFFSLEKTAEKLNDILDGAFHE